MTRFITHALALLALVLSTAVLSQETPMEGEVNPLATLDWQAGPDNFNVARLASIELQAGYDYLDAANTTRLMEMMENPTSGQEYYAGPEDMRWFSVFEYDDTGHIEDNENIDPEDLLASLREGNKIGNEERRKRGWTEFKILGWQYEPFYDEEDNRLTWAILGESDGQPVINYNTRLLGRTGVMSVTLVSGVETLDSDLAEFKSMLGGFEYNQGQRYAEYEPGDKLATYGLAALVTGGAAAAVVKSGAGKSIVKIVIAGAAALFAFFGGAIKRVFKRQ
jgi:uncharacterized membrane-anchored protein